MQRRVYNTGWSSQLQLKREIWVEVCNEDMEDPSKNLGNYWRPILFFHLQQKYEKENSIKTRLKKSKTTKNSDPA